MIRYDLQKYLTEYSGNEGIKFSFISPVHLSDVKAATDRQLEKGNPKKALEHFKEALKQEPNLESAKAGIVHALKAKNIN